MTFLQAGLGYRIRRSSRSFLISPPMHWTAIVAAIMAAALAGACASRPESGFLAPIAAVEAGSTSHTILVATTRQRDERPGTLFNGERAMPLDFARIDVSVPPTHTPGEIEWASTAPGDPRANFVVRQAGYLEGEQAFIRSLNAQLALRPRGSRNVVLFIHGYNTMFAEGLYRFAQVMHDSQPVLHSPCP